MFTPDVVDINHVCPEVDEYHKPETVLPISEPATHILSLIKTVLNAPVVFVDDWYHVWPESLEYHKPVATTEPEVQDPPIQFDPLMETELKLLVILLDLNHVYPELLEYHIPVLLEEEETIQFELLVETEVKFTNGLYVLARVHVWPEFVE